jgi:uncharacterized protein YdbL (DUF1318 family)
VGIDEGDRMNLKHGVYFDVRFETKDNSTESEWVIDEHRDRSYQIQTEFHQMNGYVLCREEFDDVMDALVESINEERYGNLADSNILTHSHICNDDIVSKVIVGRTGSYRLVSYRKGV